TPAMPNDAPQFDRAGMRGGGLQGAAASAASTRDVFGGSYAAGVPYVERGDIEGVVAPSQGFEFPEDVGRGKGGVTGELKTFSEGRHSNKSLPHLELYATISKLINDAVQHSKSASNKQKADAKDAADKWESAAANARKSAPYLMQLEFERYSRSTT